METRRDVFQAIADPTRRAILLLLAAQAMTPNALAEEFHTSRQAVSKHIQILTECELVSQEQKGEKFGKLNLVNLTTYYQILKNHAIANHGGKKTKKWKTICTLN